jgi:hypothetical protein
MRAVGGYLGSDGVRARGEELRDASGFEARLAQAKGSAKTSTASAHNYRIVLMVDDGIRLGELCQRVSLVRRGGMQDKPPKQIPLQKEQTNQTCSAVLE